MTTRSLLITGVSGYIGGTILSALLKDQSQWTKQLKINCLVRSESQASAVQKLGASPIIITSFNEIERLEKIAEDYDIIIHAGAGWHTPSAQALITGQGTRKSKIQTSHSIHYIQISGTINLSDRPYTDNYTDTHLFTDEEDIYSFEKYRESRETHPARTTDIAVIETGEAVGVNTYIIMAPTIFGQGTGPFNRYSMQLPSLIADALSSGVVSVIEKGNTVWSHVHVEDLAGLFVVLLDKICAGLDIPSGKKGIYFCETGEHSHREFSTRLAAAAYELGVLRSSGVKEITLQEAGERVVFGGISTAELGYASNARTKAILGRKLGWMPSHGEEWETNFRDEVTAFIKNPPGEREIPEFLRRH
ncbi:hypothetical protein ASPBRDRAFT_145701 [Aspergillus brasiliensis CBS 101740]|uniref:NAD-dependent epimerase/dehydratase domain-containing protein n=1 Tax=Aspergillus brasiliensis (strain CBS 101740 / IMI 381727 / IBT 21946) TaxID=767769 RepID=A0A1L9UY79_ASPBC|nr:hypothetical protein ASPBRDRAFT_145701 [Aspergillus brasiliensis CBS 101740]